MGLAPKIDHKKPTFILKKCTICSQSLGPESFSQTKSIFYPDGYLPICNDCLEGWLSERDYSWDAIDKICQYADVPFIPKEWERIHDLNPDNTFQKYCEVFLTDEYDGLGWDDYFKAFKELKESGLIERELPLISDEQRKELQQRWGANYDDEALEYLENLFQGLKATQNVSGALQVDQALKICKMSYEIDCRIRAGEDFDKLLSAYDKTVKAADFTPKTAKNATDFESVGKQFAHVAAMAA